MPFALAAGISLVWLGLSGWSSRQTGRQSYRVRYNEGACGYFEDPSWKQRRHLINPDKWHNPTLDGVFQRGIKSDAYHNFLNIPEESLFNLGIYSRPLLLSEVREALKTMKKQKGSGQRWHTPRTVEKMVGAPQQRPCLNFFRMFRMMKKLRVNG